MAGKNVCFKNETILIDTIMNVKFKYYNAVEINAFVETFKQSLIVHFLMPFVFLLYFVNVTCFFGFGSSNHRKILHKETENLELQQRETPHRVRSNIFVEQPKNYGLSKSLDHVFSSPKEFSHLELKDIRKIRYVENQESQEEESEYDAGGYMPVNLGDILKDRFQVCRKLGWGHFSTVWLCKNLKSDGPFYVALKICKSAHVFATVAQDEITLLQQTRSTDPNHPGYVHIVQMVDTFKLLSINGVHTAISMEIMGPSLLHLLTQSDFRGIQAASVKRIIQQVLKGLTYLHKSCQIIHTDIKPENILIKVDQVYINRLIGKTERFSQLGEQMPRSYVTADCWVDRDKDIEESDEMIMAKFDMKRGRSYPHDKYLNELADFHSRHSEPRLTAPLWVSPNIEIKIADLGNACWEYHHFSNEIQTRQYRALEVILNTGYSFPADIWSVGCVAFELATGEMLFSPKGERNHSADLDHLCLIWETLGGIPQYIIDRGAESRSFFHNGRFKTISDEQLRIWKIEDVLVEKYCWKRVDAIPFAGFLESLVEPDPDLRLTSETALQHDWLNSSNDD